MKPYLLLLTAFSSSLGSASAQPPPGCLCTIEQCCKNNTDYDCSVLQGHLGILGAFTMENFCQPYLKNGSLMEDASMGVCDAILADTSFRKRFVESLSESSFWTETTQGSSCGDLVVDSCPTKAKKNPLLMSSWTAVRQGSCGSSSVDIISADTTKTTIVLSSGCAGSEMDGVLNLVSGTVPAWVDPPTCPENPTLLFTEEASEGIEQKRWMCHEYTTMLDGNLTSIRSYYVNLGNFPCKGPTPAPTETDTPEPTVTSDATRGSFLSGWVLLCFILWL